MEQRDYEPVRKALAAYGEEQGAVESITDLLTDLLHYADHVAPSLDLYYTPFGGEYAIGRARDNYEAEKDEES